MIQLLLLYLICASTFTISKSILGIAAPLFYVGFRMFCAGVLLCGIAWLRGYRLALRLSQIQWGLFLQVVLFHVFFAFTLDLWAMQYIASWEAAFLYNLSPFITAFIAWMWFRERLGWLKFLAMIIGSLSIAPFIFRYYGSWSGLLPIAGMLGAVASSAYGWLVISRLIREHALPAIVVNGIGMLGGGLLALLASYGFEGWTPVLPVADWSAFLWQTALIILISNFIFYNFYGYLLGRYSATMLSFAGCTCPFFATVLGWFFLGEPLSWDLLFTGIFSLVGVYLFYRQELTKVVR